jgi:hypothetical protein
MTRSDALLGFNAASQQGKGCVQLRRQRGLKENRFARCGNYHDIEASPLDGAQYLLARRRAALQEARARPRQEDQLWEKDDQTIEK